MNKFNIKGIEALKNFFEATSNVYREYIITHDTFNAYEADPNKLGFQIEMVSEFDVEHTTIIKDSKGNKINPEQLLPTDKESVSIKTTEALVKFIVALTKYTFYLFIDSYQSQQEEAEKYYTVNPIHIDTGYKHEFEFFED